MSNVPVPSLPDEVPPPITGGVLLQAAWAGVALFAATATSVLVVPGLVVLSVPVALLLFVAGTVAFASAYWQGVQRSRDDAISVADLFFLTHCAPRSVRRSFLGALLAQVVVAMVTAAMRPYSALAFGVMAPMWALGLAGLWGARYGAFPPRNDGPQRRPDASAAQRRPPPG